jgi:hypothetical protein
MGRSSVEAINAWWMLAVRAARAARLDVTAWLACLWLLALGFLCVEDLFLTEEPVEGVAWSSAD